MLMVQAGGGPGFLRQSAASGGIRLTGSLLVPSPYTHTHTHTNTHTHLWHFTDAHLSSVIS